MILRVLILFFSVVLFSSSISAQEKKSAPEKQAVFIFNFFKFIEWPNYNELNNFNVGVIGDVDDLVYNELVTKSKTEKAKELPINIIRLNNLNQLDDIQLLYFDKSASLKFDAIYKAIANKHILLVSKDYPYGKSMINFIMDDDKLQYELNETKCEEAGLKVDKVLTLIAIKSEKKWNGLINKFEDLANTDGKTVKIDTKDLAKIVKEQKRLLSEIGTNTKKLEVQKDKLKKQQTELSAKENQLINTKKEIEKQKGLITEQLQKISLQQQNLSALNENVVVKQQELVKQQEKLEIEKENLIAIQEEYATIEKALKLKEILVKKQGVTIDEQGNEIITKADKIEEQKSIIWLSIIFLIIVSVLGILAYRSYRLKNKANIVISSQKAEIEEQHHILEEQHKEITDSISYAKRIQNAILPPLKLVRGYMPDSFILYQPKDIVAGDFYWMEGVNNLIIFAAADCTGHGVPGAMVSVVCHNAMNRAVREFMLVEPDEILNKTREIVLETFEKSDEQVNDGMDIALCTINTETNKLSFAGANNSLYFIRGGELSEIKPDKQPIGKYDEAKSFTKHEIDLEKGDVIYTFSDGYPDQFGGPKGKKFMYKPFRKLLLSIHEKPMEEQHALLSDAFQEWRGEIEQIDDVCVIGVRI
jgi:serine phosphatase RsbU (regulator of sigma subunit)